MIRIKRKTKYENRFHPNMGRLKCKVTRIYKSFLGIPFKLIHKYRETYYGEVKECDDCEISK
jgi:hypothetical protein